MASIHQDPRNQRFTISLLWAGKQYRRSLQTTNRREADMLLGRVNSLLWQLKQGLVAVPDWASDRDPVAWIVSGGTLEPPRANKPRNQSTGGAEGNTIASIAAKYFASIPKTAKADSTIKTERLHVRRFVAHWGERFNLAAGLTAKSIQAYVNARVTGGCGAETVKKELGTLSLIWKFAVTESIVAGEFPRKGVTLPRRAEKPIFRTLDDTVSFLGRVKLPAKQVREIWKAVVLTRADIAELINLVEGKDHLGQLTRMVWIASYTGARRSEMLRLTSADVDFASGVIVLTEKKQRHGFTSSTRTVPLHDKLRAKLLVWCEIDGPLISNRNGEPISKHYSVERWREVVAGTRFEKLPGYHVLRHSFASGLAMAGVRQDLIDAWMGHQTEEMRRRYRHLFPSEQRDGIGRID